MSNTREKKLKRKRKLQKRKAQAADPKSFHYEGQKYRQDRYVPLMYGIEKWLCTLDEAMSLRGVPALSDSVVEGIYRKLIIDFRNHGIAVSADQPEKTEFSWKRDISESAVYCLNRLITYLAREGNYSLAEVTGVLRTLNSSRETWTETALTGRGYIDYLQRNIGPDYHQAETLSGVQERDDFRTLPYDYPGTEIPGS